MPAQDKPYRVYRGGRVKGRVPLTREAAPGSKPPPGAPAGPSAPKRRHWGRWVGVGLLVLVVLLVVWGVASYLAVSSGVSEANGRVPAGVKRQLATKDGLLISTPTTILVLGTDGGRQKGRAGANRSDSIMLIRTDPGKKRLAFLSIPRDLQVEIPEVGVAKINAANQIGGPALALRTVKDLTGLPVNHVVFVDFDRFRELIDAVGGIDVVVPRKIRSDRFDCPYKTAKRCAEWPGWRFAKGKQHMDGQRALVYSRIRHNLLDPAENDFTRARRQQDVVEATLNKVTSVRHLAEAPVRRRPARRPARDRPRRLSADAARLGLLSRRQGQGAALPARRRPCDRRRRVGDPRQRGQRLDRRDVHGPLCAARARAGLALRARLLRGRPGPVSGIPGDAASFSGARSKPGEDRGPCKAPLIAPE